MNIKKLLKILGLGVLVVAAAGLFFSLAPLLKTHAAGTSVPVVTFTPVSNPDGGVMGGHLTISGSGP